MDRLEPREELCEPALCSANVVEDRAREEEEVAEFAASGPLDSSSVARLATARWPSARARWASARARWASTVEARNAASTR
jgi:hypothetical protein